MKRRREDLRRSLENPHPQSTKLGEMGFDDWAGSLPDEDVSDIVDATGGTPVRWVPGEGWSRLDPGIYINVDSAVGMNRAREAADEA